MAEKTKISAETIVSTSELASVLRITGRRIRQLAEDGVLEKTEGGFALGDSVKKYYEMKTPSDEDVADAKVDKTKRMAEAQFKAAKATIEKLKADELKGKMHRSEDVAAMTESLIYTIRSALISLPGRLAVDVSQNSSPAECSEIIRTEVYAIMNELAQFKYDSKKYEERVRERMEWDTDDSEDDDE